MLAKKGLAFIVANSIYDAQKNIESCEKDGFDMVQKFEKMNFDILKSFNATRNEFFLSIEEFISVSELYSTIVFYFSGHGVQIDGNNYLVPKDCLFNKNKDILIGTSLVDLKIITNFMEKNPDKTNIIILDACRTNPFLNKGFISNGLSEVRAGSGTFISFATAPNTVSGGYDNNNYNSTFTKYLLKHIDKPNIKIEDMFKLVRSDVEKDTNKEQIPWESTSLKSDFYFNTLDDDSINQVIYNLMTNTNKVECLLYLSEYLRMSISDVMRKYEHYKSNLPGGIYLNNNEMENYILKTILDLGFYVDNYRWVYNNTPVTMGEFFHNPKTFNK